MRDADHQLELQLGGVDADDTRRLIRLRIAQNKCGTFEPLPGVPATREQCPTDRHTKGCPYVNCREHLWRVDSCDRAGRPSLSKVPRGAKGYTLQAPGSMGSDRPPATLEPRWLEEPVPPSCALDVADKVNSADSIGKVMGRDGSLVRMILRAALAKLIAKGVDVTDMLRLMQGEEG